MPGMLKRGLWLIVLSLLLNLLMVSAFAQFYVEPSNAELRSTSYFNLDWQNSQKAKLGDQINLRATMYVSYRGNDYRGPGTTVDAYAEIEGCNSRYCIPIGNTSTESEYIMTGQYQDISIQWNNVLNNILTAESNYESYRFTVHARTSDTDYSENPSAPLATLNVIKDKAYCSQLELTTHSITPNENTSYNDYFEIKNFSTEDFTIDGAPVNSNNPFVTFVPGSRPTVLSAGRYSNINFTVNASNVDSGTQGYENGSAGLSGRFRDSQVSCTLGTQTFYVHARDTSSFSTGKCSQITSTPYTLYIDEGQTQSFGISVRNDSNEDLGNVLIGVVDDSIAFNASIDPNSQPARLGRNGTNTIGVIISAENVSYTQSGTAYVRIEGDFLDSSEACRNDKIEIPISVVVRNTSGNSDCNHISISADNVQVNENSTKTIPMAVNNSDERGFYIDELQAYDYSSVFDSSAIDRPGLVSGKSTSAFNASISSFMVSSDTSGTAYVKLKGHFSDGQKCDYFDVPEKSFTVKVKNSGNVSNLCSQITLQPYSIVAKPNSIETQNFYVQNYSGQTFYIDNANIYDSEQYFEASTENYDSFALAGSNAVVKARVSASSPSSTVNALAYFQVRGHFADSTYCSYSDIGTKSFSVRVEGAAEGQACSNFSLSAPSELGVNGRTLLGFTYSNPLGSDATLVLNAQGAAIEKTSFVLPANSSNSLSTYVTMGGSGTSLIEYSISAGNCAVPSRFTTLRAGTASLAGNVEIERYPYPIVLQSNEFDVSVAVSSNSGSTASVVIGLESVPSDWETKSVTVALQPYEKARQVQLHVKAENLEYSGSVRLSMQTQSETFSRIIAVQPKSGQQGITLSASVNQKLGSNDLEVKVVATNNSGATASGKIELSLPKGWAWSGDNSVILEAGQQKELLLAVKPAGAVSDEDEIGVKFVPSSASVQETSALVKARPSVPLLPSALAGLGGGQLGLTIALIIIICVVAAGLFRLGLRQKLGKQSSAPRKRGAGLGKKGPGSGREGRRAY